MLGVLTIPIVVTIAILNVNSTYITNNEIVIISLSIIIDVSLAMSLILILCSEFMCAKNRQPDVLPC